MQYQDFYEFDGEKVSGLLSSGEMADVINGTLYTVLGSGDNDKSDELIRKHLNSENQMLVEFGLRMISSLVRINKRIDFDFYAPIIENELGSFKNIDSDDVYDLVWDIWCFTETKYLKKSKSEIGLEIEKALRVKANPFMPISEIRLDSKFQIVDLLNLTTIGENSDLRTLLDAFSQSGHGESEIAKRIVDGYIDGIAHNNIT